MIEPSNALASIVRQSGLQEFADAITVAQPRAHRPEVQIGAGASSGASARALAAL